MKSAALLFALVLAGCGASTAPSLTRLPDTTRFVPNYLGELSATRQWGTQTLTISVPTALRSTFEASQAAWAAQYGTLLVLSPTASTPADIQVDTVPAGSLWGDVVGLTTVTYQGSRIISATIHLDASLSGESVKQVLAHELGHALGVDGHSADPSDLMYPRSHLPFRITPRDRNTLLSIYADWLPSSTRKKDDGSAVTTVVCRFPKS